MTLQHLDEGGAGMLIREYYERIVAYGLGTAWGKRPWALERAST